MARWRWWRACWLAGDRDDGEVVVVVELGGDGGRLDMKGDGVRGSGVVMMLVVGCWLVGDGDDGETLWYVVVESMAMEVLSASIDCCTQLSTFTSPKDSESLVGVTGPEDFESSPSLTTLFASNPADVPATGSAWSSKRVTAPKWVAAE
ncbi:hypothetical protein Tco_0479112 [Tanacetum coccineum]